MQPREHGTEQPSTMCCTSLSPAASSSAAVRLEGTILCLVPTLLIFCRRRRTGAFTIIPKSCVLWPLYDEFSGTEMIEITDEMMTTLEQDLGCMCYYTISGGQGKLCSPSGTGTAKCIDLHYQAEPIKPRCCPSESTPSVAYSELLV